MPRFILDTFGAVDQPADDPAMRTRVGRYRSDDEFAPLEWRDLDSFTQGYIEALFFTSQGDDGEAFEQGFSDLAPEALARIISDCAAFQASGTAWCTYAQSPHVKSSADAATEQQAGGDFWFTRNRSGVGFWEREPGVYGTHADALTDAAYAFGEVDAYLGDDGRVYL